MSVNGKIHKISSKLYILRTPNFDAKVTFGVGSSDVVNAPKGFNSAKSKLDHIPLGEKGDFLYEMHSMVCESPNKLRLLKTRRDFILGEGLEVRTKVVKDGKKQYEYVDDAETNLMEDWVEDNRLNSILSEAALQMCFSGRAYIKLTLSINAQPEKLELIDVFHCCPARSDKLDNGITAYKLNPNFGNKLYKKEETKTLPAFDFSNPIKYAVSIIDLRQDMPGQIFHPWAEWWGTKNWTGVSNKVPKFHNSGLDNGYNLKYHFSIPDDYFRKDEYTEEEVDEETLKSQILSEMAASLAGTDNVDKAFFTFHKVMADRGMVSEVKITPLDNKMSDTAYTELFNTANVAQASGHGVLPSLAGIDTGSKLGGSGKELEAAANYQQGFLTWSDRELLLTIPRIVQKLMNWDRNKQFVFRNISLYTYDVTPKNTTQNQNQQP